MKPRMKNHHLFAISNNNAHSVDTQESKIVRQYIKAEILRAFEESETAQVQISSVTAMALGLRTEKEVVLQELEALKAIGYDVLVYDVRKPTVIVDTFQNKLRIAL